MLDAALIFGVVCACVAFGYGGAETLAELVTDHRRRTPLVLLLSVMVSLLLSVYEAPFVLPLWLAIDALVILAIVWPHWRPRDWPKNDVLVLAFFPPIWVCYLIDGWTGYTSAVLLVSAQMATTFPAKRAWDDARRFASKRRKNGTNDMRVVHVR